MGIPLEHARVESHHFEEADHAIPRGRLAEPRMEVEVDRLSDLIPDPVDRVPRVHGALEHHRDRLPPALAHGVFVEGEEVFAVEADLAGVVAGVVGRQAHQRHRNGSLAAARLPHQAQRLALMQREADILDGRNLALLGLVAHDQAIDFEKRPSVLSHCLLIPSRPDPGDLAVYRCRSLGLTTSSIALPTRKKDAHRRLTASPAGIRSHQ